MRVDGVRTLLLRHSFAEQVSNRPSPSLSFLEPTFVLWVWKEVESAVRIHLMIKTAAKLMWRRLHA